MKNIEDTEYRICKKCETRLPKKQFDETFSVCPECGYYMRFHAYNRIKALADDHKFEEWDAKQQFNNPLNDQEYQNKLMNAYKKYHLKDAIVTGKIEIDGQPVAIGVMDNRFMMASMGHMVGEKVTRLVEEATRRKLPVIIFCSSGGARIQEGIISLMQMEKTAAAIKRHSDKGLLYISVLTEPTMGGVTASFATLADVILAEKGAMIGFAGPRVIEQNTGEKLPKGFQTSEFQLEHGWVDQVVSRPEMKNYLSRLLKLYSNHKKISYHGTKLTNNHAPKNIGEYKKVDAWEVVKVARSKERPTTLDYINALFDHFVELHGDRSIKDDNAMVAGIAEFHGQTVTIIGQQKGKGSMNDAIHRNFGMASPEGYRKALRLMKQAEKFKYPIICFIDTIGAACGKEAEERGQGGVIAQNLYEMSTLGVPILSIVIGEGGSGGALALGVGNEVWMLENSVYYVLTPEAYASIVWRDNSRAHEAAERMKLRARDLYELGVIDRIIQEEEPVSVNQMEPVCKQLDSGIQEFLNQYNHKSKKVLIRNRYDRFRKL